MADKMATADVYTVMVNLTQSFLNQISSKFHIWIASIKLSFKLEYGFCPMNDYQDDQQNGHRLSVCSAGHPTLVIYYLIASIFRIWITFIKLSPKFEYMGFVR